MAHPLPLVLGGNLAGLPVLLGEIPQVDVDALSQKRTLKLLFTSYVSKSCWQDKLGKFISIHFTVGLSEFMQSDSHLSFSG